ncbi:hypothetical protein [Streptomyces sp. NPDC048508]|uniref:hypothetical protein n=1 Tax=Streptomyces sp. NPDC048508 TaxID=3365561 RepID=UPI003722C5F2
MSAIHRAPVEQQRTFWARRFRDAGWQTDRCIEGVKDNPPRKTVAATGDWRLAAYADAHAA